MSFQRRWGGALAVLLAGCGGGDPAGLFGGAGRGDSGAPETAAGGALGASGGRGFRVVLGGGKTGAGGAQDATGGIPGSGGAPGSGGMAAAQSTGGGPGLGGAFGNGGASGSGGQTSGSGGAACHQVGASPPSCASDNACVVTVPFLGVVNYGPCVGGCCENSGTGGGSGSGGSGPGGSPATSDCPDTVGAWHVYTVQPLHCLWAGDPSWGGTNVYWDKTPGDGVCSTNSGGYLRIRVGAFSPPVTVAVVATSIAVVMTGSETQGDPDYDSLCLQMKQGFAP